MKEIKMEWESELSSECCSGKDFCIPGPPGTVRSSQESNRSPPLCPIVRHWLTTLDKPEDFHLFYTHVHIRATCELTLNFCCLISCIRIFILFKLFFISFALLLTRKLKLRCTHAVYCTHIKATPSFHTHTRTRTHALTGSRKSQMAQCVKSIR